MFTVYIYTTKKKKRKDSQMCRMRGEDTKQLFVGTGNKVRIFDIMEIGYICGASY